MSCCGNAPVYGNTVAPGFGSCCCNLPTLVILILIILQFGKGRRTSSEGGGKLVDNGILFIIALFYLSCCNPCKNMY